MNFIVVLIFSLVGFISFAEDKIKENADIADKVLECSVFYRIGSDCMGDTHQEARDKGSLSSFKALTLALNFYRKADVSTDASIAKYKMMHKEMSDSISNKCQNISVLTLKYGDNCKNLISDKLKLVEQEQE